MRKLIAIVLTVALVFAVCAIMAGCGDNKAADTTPTTQAATQAVKATTAPAAQSNDNSGSSAADTDTDDNDDDDDSDGSSEYAGITYDKACSLALDRSGSGASIYGCYQGYMPDGNGGNTQAWIVTVLDADGSTRTYYCGFPFCIPVDDPVSSDTESDFANISEDKARSLVLERLGDGAEITGVSQGTMPNGDGGTVDAWIVTATDADGNSHSYYCGFPFCIEIQ